MFERFTAHARRALQLEGLEAKRMHHAWLGTEHLLLGLLREKEGTGSRALNALGLTLAQVRKVVAELSDKQDDVETPDTIPQTPQFQHVMHIALHEARKLKAPQVGTEHLLLALLAEDEGAAVDVLKSINVAPAAVRAQLLWMLETEA
jgi:ATP-dependent Clp protease ATP-binding subunit ClpC